MMKVDIVLGLGFGDEGKGMTVNSLIKNPQKTLVVRFNGGHQAGHQVVYQPPIFDAPLLRHIFSNFGSGTLKSVPTYWSEYCIIDPVGFCNEWEILDNKGRIPTLVANENCMITTPMDKYLNKITNQESAHGSVGVGFGETIQRNENNYRLYLRDLYFPLIRDIKLDMMLENYFPTSKLSMRNDLDKFKLACDSMLLKIQKTSDIKEILPGCTHIIFEGAQSIMLDQKYGFFPHVTRSNCTSENAYAILNQCGLDSPTITTYYVTRTYQTRHGNGPMTTTLSKDNRIKENPHETNVSNYQGEFRKGILDLNLLKYAIECDSFHNSSDKKVVLSCLDHCYGQFETKVDDSVILLDDLSFQNHIGYPVIGSYSEKGF